MRLRRLLAASVSYPCPFTSLVSSTMASSPNSAALILFHPHTLVKRSEERDQGKNWALTLSGFTLSPGRTLDRVYTVWGHALEKQANRVAHKIGLGPHATTQKLKVFFGDGEQRLLKLENLRTCTPSRVHNYCANLTKYTLSTEGLTTRLRAFKNIVHLCTQFLGLRRIFLGCKYMQGATSAASISQLWDPSLTVPNEEWSFWQGLAAACLSETTVSTLLEDTPLLEGTPLAKLTYCPDEGLSVIERLLVEWNCSADCTFSAALCVRYLGGILDLPGFWAEMGAVQSLVAEKLCREMVRALKDIGVYVLQLGLLGEADPPFDYDGLDLLSATMLVGLSSWFKKLNEQERPLQPWYHPLREVLRLLRAPRSLDLLPQAAAYAVGIWETLLPLRSTIAEVDVTARCEDGDGSGDEITIVDLSPDAPLASVTGTLLGGSDHVNEDDSVPTPESNDGEPATEPHTSEESGSTDPPPELSTLEEPGSEDAPMDEVDIDPTRAHAEQSEPRKDSAAQDPREASVTATDSMINNLENTDTREDSADARGDLFDPTLDHPDRPEILQDSLKAWENSERSSSPPALDDVNEKQATSDAAEDSGGHIEQSNRETNQADEAAGEEKSDAQSASAAASHCNENQELESSLNSGHEEIAPSVTNSDTQAEPGVGVEIGHNKSRDVKPGTILNRSEDSGPVHVVDVVPGIGSDGTPTAQGENSTETAGLASRPNAVLVPSQRYLPGKVVPENHNFSILKELKHIRTGRLYSFKKGKESVKDGLQLVVNERLMQHINIASLGYYFETRRSHYFDLYSGRLFDDIVAKGSYSETEAAPLVATILSAVNHLHNEGIVHGNLKAENLLFRHHPGRDIVITDSDFMITGITNDLERIHITSLTELLRHWPAEPGEPAIPSWLSTPCSASPEIHGRRPHEFFVDIRAIGAVTCFMLAGAKPFERATRKAESDVIIAGDYGFGENVSNAARDLIRACLAIDPAHRSTAAEALRHEWFNEVAV